jgi:hypothetical protein
MNEIIRTNDDTEHGLPQRYILGMDIFRGITGIPFDPRIMFLKALSEQVSCSAHVGSLALTDIVDTPEELFGPPRSALPYSHTRISFDGKFYDLGDYPSLDALFFPLINATFWEAHTSDEDNAAGDELRYLIRCHGLAMYVGGSSSAPDAMTSLLSAPFPGVEQWLQEATRLYSLVVVIGHDGGHFEAYARDEASFNLMDAAISLAETAIRSSAWFLENEHTLVWDELNLCLRLPR